MPAQCNFCSKKLSDKRSLKKHVRAIHPEQIQPVEYTCSECNAKHFSLPEIHQHVVNCHSGNNIHKHCLYCNIVFLDENSFVKHTEDVHGLPTWDNMDGARSDEFDPVESAINGNIKVFELFPQGTEKCDILDLFVSKKDQIDTIVRQYTLQSPQKVQIRAEVSLSKPSMKTDEREKITIYLNSDMMAVFYECIPMETFLGMVEQMIQTLVSFASHGSGWSVDSINKSQLVLTRFAPIRGSSYIALPTALARYCHLLNVRNQSDNNCFKYCFTAAYHTKYGPPLYGEKSSWRVKTSPHTYSLQNPVAHQPVGEFDMPMSLNDIPRFERLNNVQVNVFRLVNFNFLGSSSKRVYTQKSPCLDMSEEN